MSSSSLTPTSTSSSSLWHTLGAILLVIFSSSFIAFTLVFQLQRYSELPEGVLILVTSVVSFGFSLILLLPFFNRLQQIHQTLVSLNNGLVVAELSEDGKEGFAPMAKEVNLLLRERTALNNMRGKLVEQITDTAAQEERSRLARDLHDSIKQQVFNISISAAAAQAHLENDPRSAREALLHVKQSAQEAMVEMRVLLRQLAPAPLEKSGLLDAIREQAEAFSYRTGAHIDIQLGNLPDNQHFPLGAQEAVFRVTQEALSNIARHARAHHVKLILQQTPHNEVMLHISDDGQGFDPDNTPVGMGLGNIRSRANAINANCEIVSKPTLGTQLTIHIPLISPETSDPQATTRKVKQTAYDGVIRWYFYLVGSICTVLFALPMVAVGTTKIQTRIETDPILNGLTVIFALLGVVGTGIAIFTYFRALAAYNEFVIRTEKDHELRYKLRRMNYLGGSLIALVAIWFLPMIWIQDGSLSLAPIVMSVIMGGYLFWCYYQSLRMCSFELRLMPQKERLAEIVKYQFTVRNSWPSLIVLFVILLLTDTFRNGIQLLPTSMDSWMTTVMVVVAILLLINQAISIWYYRHHQQVAELELAS